MPSDVVVVGSLNHDLTILATRHPGIGETVLGTGHFTGAGGKGANQAVAVARLGTNVAMIGRVGDDDQGRVLVSVLEAAGVDTSGVVTDVESPTGVAVITLDDRGENTIVVSPGANANLTADDIWAAEAAIRDARVVLAQLEVPIETVLAARSIASGLFCLNPAPARELPEELLARVDVLIPNRSELARLAGCPEPESLSEVVETAVGLGFDGALVVTLGPEGAVVVENGMVTPIAAPRVTAVDTTGAGDAFCGALASSLCHGELLTRAALWASAAGAIAATRKGAQAAMPSAAEVEALLLR
jgi:ribokinase